MYTFFVQLHGYTFKSKDELHTVDSFDRPFSDGGSNPPISTKQLEPLFGAFVLWRWEHCANAQCGRFEQAEQCGQKITSLATIFSESVLKSFQNGF